MMNKLTKARISQYCNVTNIVDKKVIRFVCMLVLKVFQISIYWGNKMGIRYRSAPMKCIYIIHTYICYQCNLRACFKGLFSREFLKHLQLQLDLFSSTVPMEQAKKIWVAESIQHSEVKSLDQSGVMQSRSPSPAPSRVTALTSRVIITKQGNRAVNQMI